MPENRNVSRSRADKFRGIGVPDGYVNSTIRSGDVRMQAVAPSHCDAVMAHFAARFVADRRGLLITL
jgi:hypothetical protein